MKKILSLMIGLGLVVGTATFAFAQTDTNKKKASKKAGTKKTGTKATSTDKATK
jgi:uncharacterized protein YxeA